MEIAHSVYKVILVQFFIVSYLLGIAQAEKGHPDSIHTEVSELDNNNFKNQNNTGLKKVLALDNGLLLSEYTFGLKSITTNLDRRYSFLKDYIRNTDFLGSTINNIHSRIEYVLVKTNNGLRSVRKNYRIGLNNLQFGSLFLSKDFFSKEKKPDSLNKVVEKSLFNAADSYSYSDDEEEHYKVFLKEIEIVATIKEKPNESDTIRRLIEEFLEDGKIYFTSDSLDQKIYFEASDSSFSFPSKKNISIQADTGFNKNLGFHIHVDLVDDSIGLKLLVDFSSEAIQLIKSDSSVNQASRELKNGLKIPVQPITVNTSDIEEYDYSFGLIFEKKAKDKIVQFYTDYLDTPPAQKAFFNWNDSEDGIFRFHPEVGFSKLWEPIKESDFRFNKEEDGENRKVFIKRKLRESSLKLKISGELRRDIVLRTRMYYTNGIESKIVDDEVILKRKDVWRDGDEFAFKTLKYVLPDSLLSDEGAKLGVSCPEGYFFEGHKSIEQKFVSKVELYMPASELQLTIRRIPAFQFLYLDLTGFDNLGAVKKILIEKIGYPEADYLLYISNGSNPVVYQTGDDFDEVLKRVSLTRPEPPITGNEVPKVQSYIDQFITEKDRVDFNFMVNEVFLKYSSKDFLNQVIDQKKLITIESAFNLFSTVESYAPPHDILKKNFTYYQIK